MRASAQVTAPGAITSMIVANRSTCSRMSVPLVQIQILGLVNRFSRRDRLGGAAHAIIVRMAATALSFFLFSLCLK